MHNLADDHMWAKTQSKPQRGCSQCGSLRANDRFGYGMRQGCLLCPQLLAIWLLDGELFLFQEAAFTTVLFWFPLVSPVILALKALCKLQCGPSWCLTTPAESDPVLLLGFTGQAALLISAVLQTKVFSYISENISHITCIFDMIQRQLTLWDFKFNWSKSQVNELCDGTNPSMEKKTGP